PTDDRAYSYQPRPKWIKMILFQVLAVVLIWLSNSVLSGFLSTLALFCGIGAILGGVLGICFKAWHQFFSAKRLVFTGTHILLPKSTWSSVEIAIPYESITTIERYKENRPPIGLLEHCVISHQDGKTAINKHMLANPQDFDDIIAELQGKGLLV